MPKLSAGTQAFTDNRANMQGLRGPRATHSNPKDHFKLPQHTNLADVMAQNKRVTMFLPRESRHGTTWGTSCLAKDTEIRLADGTFALLQDSVGEPIWTDQQEEKIITQIRKFDTDEADPGVFGIGVNWITGTHFIWGQKHSQWYRACDIPGVKKTFKNSPKGSVYADDDDCFYYFQK